MQAVRRATGRDRREGGQATVEFALLLPMLLLLLFGAIQFGQVFATYLTVAEAAHDCARGAALGDDVNTATQLAQQAAVAAGLQQDALFVSVTGTPGSSGVGWQPGTAVTCQVIYMLPVVVPLFWPILGPQYPVRSASVMLAEGV